MTALPCSIGLIGWGTVGGGVIDILNRHGELIATRCGRSLHISTIVTRTPARQRDQDPGSAQIGTDIAAILDDPSIEIVLLLVGGTDVAKEYCQACLQAGKHVVTANKAIIAECWDELFPIAAAQGVCLAYEAAVAGSIPIIDSLRDAFAANSVQGLSGILNGTCNFILTRMEQDGLAYHEALAEAQERGYAEADPTLDVNGYDTAHKLAILARLAFGATVSLDDFPITGIEHLSSADLAAARRFGTRIKLLGVARRCAQGLQLSVAPRLVPLDHQIASINQNYNAVFIENDFAGPSLLVGQGAGAHPTASAVLADVIDLASGSRPHAGPRRNAPTSTAIELLSENGQQLGYYLRFTVNDQPGALASICQQLGQHAVSVLSIHQDAPEDSQHASIIVLTHPCRLGALQQALTGIDQTGILTAETVVMELL